MWGIASHSLPIPPIPPAHPPPTPAPILPPPMRALARERDGRAKRRKGGYALVSGRGVWRQRGADHGQGVKRADLDVGACACVRAFVWGGGGKGEGVWASTGLGTGR